MSSKPRDFDGFFAELDKDPEHHIAYIENNLRRTLGQQLQKRADLLGKTRHQIASEARVQPLHVRRALCHSLGGELPLRAILAISNVLGFEVELILKDKENDNE